MRTKRLKLSKEWWIKILMQARVEWTDHGHNVKKGNINIHCPFCWENASSGFHMGINPESGMYGCWRNSSHRGRSPHRLLMKLLRLNKDRVAALLGEAEEPDLDSWQELVSGSLFASEADSLEDEQRQLYLPEEFKPVKPFGESSDYFNYIESRGFPRKDVRKVISAFNLHYCDEWNDDPKKNWCYRIITPVTLYGELVTWGSRSIRPSEKLRYKSLSKEDSLVPVKNCIYNFDAALEGGRVLLMVEGQVDVWKLDFYGKEFGIRAVGLFSKALVPEQEYLLAELFPNFRHHFVLLDAGEEVDAWLMSRSLSSLHNIKSLSFTEAEDPGAARPDQLRNFFKEILKKLYPKRQVKQYN